VHSISRVVFRTGVVNRFPDADTRSDQDFDVKGAGEMAKPAVFYIRSFKASTY